MDDLQRRLSEKMYDCYAFDLTKEDCDALALDVLDAMRVPKLRRGVMEWLNGKTRFTDHEVNGFHLVVLARQLDTDHPNIPVAALLLYLESLPDTDDAPNLYRGLPALAAGTCAADTRLLSSGKPCRLAIREDGHWCFFQEMGGPAALRSYQLWQVLLLNPKLIIPVALQTPGRMAVVMRKDGAYDVLDEADISAME